LRLGLGKVGESAVELQTKLSVEDEEMGKQIAGDGKDVFEFDDFKEPVEAPHFSSEANARTATSVSYNNKKAHQQTKDTHNQ